MLDLSSRLRDLPPVRGRAPWPQHEYVKGWGVFGLPFESGHVLALRVFPEGDFAPYRALWHRDPAGHWSIHVDGPRLDTACPRYFGAACDSTGFATIDIAWTGPASLRVQVDTPSLEWTLTASETTALRLLNAIGARLPLWTWQPQALVGARERLARWLGAGDMKLSGTMPSGHIGTLMPSRMYFVQESKATLDGTDLGRPTRLAANPTIGPVPLPARGILATGQGVWTILDPAEYERTKQETERTAPANPQTTDRTGTIDQGAVEPRWICPRSAHGRPATRRSAVSRGSYVPNTVVETGARSNPMELNGALSNPLTRDNHLQVQRCLAAVGDMSIGERAPDRPSQRLPRRQGSVLVIVTSILENAPGPMRVWDIHTAVEELLGQPVPYSTVKDALATHARGNARHFRRTHRGYYELL